MKFKLNFFVRLCASTAFPGFVGSINNLDVSVSARNFNLPAVAPRMQCWNKNASKLSAKFRKYAGLMIELLYVIATLYLSFRKLS